MLAQALFENGKPFASAWNFGPEDEGNRTVEQVIDILSGAWGNKMGWQQDPSAQPHESNLLKLDCSKAHQELRWAPKWKLDQSIEKIVQWHQAFKARKDMKAISLEQIGDYLS
jgi:CDP-glucose 4,6-dehydratase